MRGIFAFGRDGRDWHIYSAPEGDEDSMFFANRYGWDGLIVRAAGLSTVRRIMRLGTPTVSVGSSRIPRDALPRVKVDDAALAELALGHLRRAGARRVAYCSFFPSASSEDRGRCFAEAAREAGLPVSVFYAPARAAGWSQRQRLIVRWLRGLQLPVGVLAWNPDVACHLVEACHVAGLRVPEDVQILSGDEDTAKLQLVRPSISALQIPAGQIGYEAAKLLDRLMSGCKPPTEPVLLPPEHRVIVRESTLPPASSDREVHAVVDLMRRHLSRLNTVADVADEAGWTRRWLERHFRQVLQTSPAAELRRLRVEEARRLLLQTDLPAKRIADLCGFGSPPQFTRTFSKAVGVGPADFRSRARREPLREPLRAAGA